MTTRSRTASVDSASPLVHVSREVTRALLLFALVPFLAVLAIVASVLFLDNKPSNGSKTGTGGSTATLLRDSEVSTATGVGDSRASDKIA